MSSRRFIRGCTGSLLALALPAALPQNPPAARTQNGSSLRDHYVAAQRLQRSGKLEDAAQQYRVFLVGSLGEVAMGYGLLRDYDHAAPLFDEALTFDPGSASLLKTYATTALVLGHPEHAKTLADALIRTNSGDRSVLAEAHQIRGRALLALGDDRQARQELETAVALDPTFANGYDLAVACLDLGDDKCAAQVFAEMQKSFGDTPALHMHFGQAYSQSDFQPRAVAEFRRALAENPRLPGAHYALAAVLLETGDDPARVAEAESELKKELALSPRDALACAALGKLAAGQRRYPEAEKYLARAICLSPRSPDAYLYLGQMDFDLHRPADAERNLRESIRLTTDVSRNHYQIQKAHFLLGRILMQQHQPDQAHAEMQIAQDLANRALSRDRTRLAALLNSDARASGPAAEPPSANTSSPTDPAAAREVNALRKRMTPAIADSYNSLGVIAAMASDYNSAIGFFEHAAEWDPTIEGLDYNWGRAALLAARYSDAIAPISRHLAAHRDDSGARNALGISQYMVRDYTGCIKTLGAEQNKDRLPSQVQYVYYESLVRTGATAAGLQGLQSLEKSNPGMTEVHRALGELLDAQGQQAQAIQELRTAIQLNNRDSAAHFDLGRIELQSGNVQDAIAELETAVHLVPGEEKFHRQLAAAYERASRSSEAQRELAASNALRAAHGDGSQASTVAPPSGASHP